MVAAETMFLWLIEFVLCHLLHNITSLMVHCPAGDNCPDTFTVRFVTYFVFTELFLPEA